jgi:hypothetical protein
LACVIQVLTGPVEACITVTMFYQRNQVAWAIARCLAFEPRKDFEREVALKLQRLIDTDRATSPEGAQLAFLEGELPGKGTTAQFSEDASFLLLIALLLLEGGLTQSRVVRLVRAFRTELCRQYEWIISNPVALRRAGRRIRMPAWTWNSDGSPPIRHTCPMSSSAATSLIAKATSSTGCAATTRNSSRP